MPFVNVRIHFVWSTKNREPYLTDPIRQTVIQHIKENAASKDIYVDHIGGYLDHLHCLISLGAKQTIESVMHLIKGESSFWINQQKLSKNKFGWQDEYFAASVSESLVPGARQYIANQEKHHRKRTFESEIDDFMTRAGFRVYKD